MQTAPVRDAAGGDRVRDIRVIHTHRKHRFTPRVCGMSRQGIHVLHRQTNTDLVLEWPRLLPEGARTFDCSEEEFAAFLLSIAKGDEGLSAPDLIGSADDPGSRLQ